MAGELKKVSRHFFSKKKWRTKPSAAEGYGGTSKASLHAFCILPQSGNRKSSSLKRRSLFFTSSPNTREALLVKSFASLSCEVAHFIRL